VWSTNRAFRVYQRVQGAASYGRLIVENSTGQVVRETDYSRDDDWFRACGYTVKGISNDGRYVAIGGCATDPSRIMFSHWVLDTVTGQQVAMPMPNSVVVCFVEGGNILVQDLTEGARALVVVAPSGQVVSRVAEPAELAHAYLVGYRP